MSEDARATVLITVDSLRADALDLTSDSSHTPALRDLAGEATVFENAFAQGNWTPFSFPSILGGAPVFADGPRIGVGNGPTLAETLGRSGMATGGFNASNGFLTAYWGYDRGFEEFETYHAEASNPLSKFLSAHPTWQAWSQFATQPFRAAARRLRGQESYPAENTSRMRDVENAAVSFIEAQDGEFFCWIHYMDTHTPYVPAPVNVRAVTGEDYGTLRMLSPHLRTGLGREVGPETLADLRTLYRAAAHQVDQSIGRVLDALEREGIRDETTVVVAGDHGEEFMEHGHLSHYPKLYRELTHVPFVVDAPDTPSRRVESPVALDAIPPTLCDLHGLQRPEGFTADSLLPTLRDGEEPDAAPIVSVTVRGDSVTQQPIPRNLGDGDTVVSVRDERWTYIECPAADERELYDRSVDPEERENRWDEAADEPGVAELCRAAQRRLDALATVAGEHDGESDEEEVPEELEDRLGALGYR
ncbi:sulfatase-like hydrolase/transferase [Haloarchaeobius sp. FL176]|uniref:sulfatase-like hydrolase/transferase n=1 Tax=Haloarchaeobius sp. FL176 TaxID=2967129 RepID=UPI0021489271|nr:sulfatase-like hydrolase/transferase [Haloarchaeobius sp. FL176]